MRVSAFLFCVVAVLASAACGAGSTGEPVIAVVPVDDGGTGVRYPLDRYQAIGAQRTAIDTAQAVLVQRCLARGGLDLPLGKAADPPARPDWYGVTTESAARAAGYNAVGRPVEDLPFVQRVPPASRDLLAGCLDETNRVLTEGAPALEDTYLVTALEKQALKRSQKDSRVQAVTGEWRACMAAAGHSFRDPWEPYTYWNNRRATERTPTPEEKRDPRSGLTDAEVAMAVTDVRCKDSTGLLDTWVAATAAYQQELVTRHAGDLRVHRRVLATTVANAERVLAADG